MAIAGAVTSAVNGTSVTMPKDGLTIVAIGCKSHTIGGYLTLNIDSGHQAIIPFPRSPRGVTAVANVVGYPELPATMWLINFPAGLKINYTGTGLTSGTFWFYFGTPFSLASAATQPLKAFAGVEVDVTTTTSLSFTFPGNISVVGIAYEPGFNAGETNFATDFTWNTATGISVDINFDRGDPLQVIPLENMGTAQSLTVTAAFDGTHVATGRLVLYYSY